MNEPGKEVLERIVEIVGSVAANDASFISVATVLGGVLRRVLSAEKTVEMAAISLGQRDQLRHMRNQTSEMIETLGQVLPERISLEKVDAQEEPSWWFALSEATHVLDESIEQLSVLVSKQTKGSPVRDLTAQIIRLMRGHYNVYLGEAAHWMDG